MVSKHILYVPAQAVAQDGQWVDALLTKCDDPWEGRINYYCVERSLHLFTAGFHARETALHLLRSGDMALDPALHQLPTTGVGESQYKQVPGHRLW